jgi:hypothetical protein
MIKPSVGCVAQTCSTADALALAASKSHLRLSVSVSSQKGGGLGELAFASTHVCPVPTLLLHECCISSAHTYTPENT